MPDVIFMTSTTLRTSPARLLSAVRSISSFVALRATSVLKHAHPGVAGANGEDLAKLPTNRTVVAVKSP